MALVVRLAVSLLGEWLKQCLTVGVSTGSYIPNREAHNKNESKDIMQMGDEQQQEQQQQDEHEAVPDEDYRPKWVDELVADNKLLHGKVDALGKTPIQQQEQQQPNRDTNGNPSTTAVATPKVEVPAPVVAPKTPSWLTRIPKWF